jgi:hypothetical protein
VLYVSGKSYLTVEAILAEYRKANKVAKLTEHKEARSGGELTA